MWDLYSPAETVKREDTEFRYRNFYWWNWSLQQGNSLSCQEIPSGSTWKKGTCLPQKQRYWSRDQTLHLVEAASAPFVVVVSARLTQSQGPVSWGNQLTNEAARQTTLHEEIALQCLKYVLYSLCAQDLLSHKPGERKITTDKREKIKKVGWLPQIGN